ncbi:N6-adenosine-methyltransferase TMT1A isoform X2 [Anolis carolinensis]|uniref:Methyltransferase type 11 domain-containing protein n=1 Tax=Anolis carolinensis TaxID=28377 RepID=G1KTN7_ANOCA|nr:PREDICTED: methyltransferase-like protein 7A isoform X2 [Anolis carolinensis]|eukprot:XP_003216972.1 PREDICTED: methyltransferase-like protein 7A isoform X2 [Anolis carolinensis]
MAVLIFLCQRCIQLLALPIFVLSFLGLWDPMCKKVFPYVMNKLARSYNVKLHKEKQQLFSNLKDFAGSSGQLSLLEIGSGTGANFQFYPSGCRVTCTDPNPNFKDFLAKSMAENQHLQFENFVVAPAEDLRLVSDGSVDVVVCTLVLCSVSNVTTVLKEVLRILKPGGAFFFMEHVASPRSSWKYFWQQVFDPTWKYLADGCSLTRETWKDLDKANFSEVKLQHINAPLNWTLVRPHIFGYAVK